MVVVDWMCLVHDWKFWKDSFDTVISLDILEWGIMFNIFHFGNVVNSFFKA